jgi:signal transduction histidine kinase
VKKLLLHPEGLAISKEIIERHGGKIEVESIFGLGTTFKVLLPTR